MTDKKTEISPAVPAVVSASGPRSESAAGQSARAHEARQRKAGSALLPAFVVVLLVAAALGATAWYQHQEYSRNTAVLSDQVRIGADTAGRAAEQARQALALAQEQSVRLTSLEAALQEAREQADSLQQAFQTLTDSGSDLVLINDIDHLVTIAQQQLQLGGNVANAIISLETAQAQLARANRPTLASLQQTVNGDLDRLRAASTVDIAALSAQLDELGNLVSQARLMVPDDAAPQPLRPQAPGAAPAAGGGQAASQDPDAPWWRHSLAAARQWSAEAWASVRHDLGEFIAVRRVDDPHALLMSPDQATRFRENLRLRIMTAQLALMMRQPNVWATETAHLVKAIESRFDQQSAESRRALKIARDMSDTNIDVRLPTVDNSLAAIETLREASAKAEDEAGDSEPSAESSEPSEAAQPSQPQPADARPDGQAGAGAQAPGARG